MSDSRRAYQRRYYRENRAKYEEARTARRHARYAYVNERKQAPCVDCGRRYAAVVMQFDHVRGDKEGDVSYLASQCASFERIQAEIDKCELRCANCHTLRTSENWYGVTE